MFIYMKLIELIPATVTEKLTTLSVKVDKNSKLVIDPKMVGFMVCRKFCDVHLSVIYLIKVFLVPSLCVFFQLR